MVIFCLNIIKNLIINIFLFLILNLFLDLMEKLKCQMKILLIKNKIFLIILYLKESIKFISHYILFKHQKMIQSKFPF